MYCLALVHHQCCRLMGLPLRVVCCITTFVLTVSCCQIPFNPKVWRVSWFFSFYWLIWQRTFKMFLNLRGILQLHWKCRDCSQHSRLWSPSNDSRCCSQVCQNKIFKIHPKKSGGLNSFYYRKLHLSGYSKSLVEFSGPTAEADFHYGSKEVCVWIVMAPVMNS